MGDKAGNTSVVATVPEQALEDSKLDEAPHVQVQFSTAVPLAEVGHRHGLRAPHRELSSKNDQGRRKVRECDKER